MTDLSRIDAYVLRLIEESEPERTAWNLEKIREGKKVTWNYIDGCMLTALMELTSITGDERYADFAGKVADHFVQEDGTILTLQPEKANLDDINEELGTNLESEDSETIGGLIIDMFGEIPDDDDLGKEIFLDNLVFTINSVKD